MKDLKYALGYARFRLEKTEREYRQSLLEYNEIWDKIERQRSDKDVRKKQGTRKISRRGKAA